MCYLGDLKTRDTVRLTNLDYRPSDTRFVFESDGFEKDKSAFRGFVFPIIQIKGAYQNLSKTVN